MIRYTLRCASDHTFDSWFPSSDSFDAQKARGLVSCPTCGATTVEKAVMAPAVSRTDREKAPQAARPEGEPTTPVTVMGEQEQAFRALLRELKDHVTRNADYVGDEFATLARQMHEGEVEHRSIYGEATADEIKALREDEVEVFPLPVLPDERN
ncbi:protein of unknown function [Azorhizobium caulinodans ORS 571]|uniref:Uncharacterized protein n=1 Tax=Azorhizobium caulinodans (strain ATCC 43989 / DSM 5975 / JCM 20966 / LMG 6465 / NBRC 14845 / NCIMB 13405 / ORS 571) TaxID=438753 RepID=A8HVB9_AZOC5|nr:DUF1178 family protein [Azorhizobium caulinodans]BAF90296.1 protein of unknown function [Azorhizobium caulinodans ORS 571]